jgi:hypothetical protein
MLIEVCGVKKIRSATFIRFCLAAAADLPNGSASKMRLAKLANSNGQTILFIG